GAARGARAGERDDGAVPAARRAESGCRVVPALRIARPPRLRIDVAEEEERALTIVRRHAAVAADLVLAAGAAGDRPRQRAVEDLDRAPVERIARRDGRRYHADHIECVEERIG